MHKYIVSYRLSTQVTNPFEDRYSDYEAVKDRVRELIGNGYEIQFFEIHNATEALLADLDKGRRGNLRLV
jgi:hypothetical protein